MSEEKIMKVSKKNFLETKGDGSTEAIVESIFKKPKPNFSKIEKSSLHNRIGSFLSQMAEADEEFEKLSEDEKEKRNMENISSCDDVLEYNVLAADDMQDSPYFQALQLSSQLTEEMSEDSDSSSDSEDSEDDSEEEKDQSSPKKKPLIQDIS